MKTATKKTTKPTIDEMQDNRGAYDMIRRSAVVDHPQHGRLYISEGWGGGNVEGETYRWRHGVCCQLLPGDTIDRLRAADWNETTSLLEAVTSGYDSTRPVLEWNGKVIERLAAKLGI